MKQSIIAIILLSVSSFSFDANAAYSELYQIEQEHITIKTDNSGLPRVLCDLYTKEDKKISNTIATVSENYDDVYILEIFQSEEKHNKTVKIVCR